MKVGIIGAGKIGSTLAREFARVGHAVRLANSRGPETIREMADSLGAKPVFAHEAAEDADVLVLSIQVTNLPKIGPALASLPASAVLIDTSNYYPYRDVRVPALDQGGVESQWVSDLLGRPVVKAWNAIMAESLARKGRPLGAVDRLAIPVAADDPAARSVALELVETCGFDALDAGVLADSWRFQPGQPAYCTDLPHELLKKALALADREKAPRLRDLIIEARTTFGDYVTADMVYLCRAMTRSPGRFHT